MPHVRVAGPRPQPKVTYGKNSRHAKNRVKQIRLWDEAKEEYEEKIDTAFQKLEVWSDPHQAKIEKEINEEHEAEDLSTIFQALKVCSHKDAKEFADETDRQDLKTEREKRMPLTNTSFNVVRRKERDLGFNEVIDHQFHISSRAHGSRNGAAGENVFDCTSVFIKALDEPEVSEDSSRVNNATNPGSPAVSQKLETLLELCVMEKPRGFTSLIDAIYAEDNPIIKIGEASYSEVFAYGPACERTVMKIIPFGKQDQCEVDDIIQEVSITKALAETRGFVGFEGAYVVIGEFPNALLGQWDYCNQNCPSENCRPDFYTEEQLFCILNLEHGGETLEDVRLRSWSQAVQVFKQAAQALARAEDRFNFEHRDLHCGNLLIKFNSRTNSAIEESPIKVTIIDYTLSRAELETMPQRMTFKDLNQDHTLFCGGGTYQFDIYRFMRRALREATDSKVGTSTEIDWSLYTPNTNVLWLHYVAHFLLNKTKGLEKPARRGKSKADEIEIRDYDLMLRIEQHLNPGKKASKKLKEFGQRDASTARNIVQWAKESALF